MFDPMTEYNGDVAWEPQVDASTPLSLTAEQADVLRLAADQKNGGVCYSSTQKKWHSNTRWRAIRGGTVQALVSQGAVTVERWRLVVTERGQGWLASHPVAAAT